MPHENADATVRIVSENPDAEVTIVGSQVLESDPSQAGQGVLVQPDGSLGIDPLGTGTIRVEDEGTTIVAAATAFNFVGAGVGVVDAGAGEATVTIPGGGGGVTDGDKGDITVSAGGTVWEIDAAVLAALVPYEADPLAPTFLIPFGDPAAPFGYVGQGDVVGDPGAIYIWIGDHQGIIDGGVPYFRIGPDGDVDLFATNPAGTVTSSITLQSDGSVALSGDAGGWGVNATGDITLNGTTASITLSGILNLQSAVLAAFNGVGIDGTDAPTSAAALADVLVALGAIASHTVPAQGVNPGDVTAGTATPDGTKGLILFSPDGADWRVTVDNAGVLSTTAVP